MFHPQARGTNLSGLGDLSSVVPDLRRKKVSFSSEIVDWLEQLADEESAPRQCVLVAAVMALLARYNGRNSVSLVIHHEGRAKLVQLNLYGNPDAAQLLCRAANALASSGESDNAPRPGGASERVEAHPTQSIPGALMNVEVVMALDDPSAPVTADLIVIAERHALNLVFRADRFEEDAISRVAEHLRALVIGMATGTGPISAIAIVHGEERAWIIAQSNAAAIDLGETLPSVVECFEQQVLKNPRALAVIDGDRELTYEQLDQAASALADSLLTRGVGAEVRVATYLERSVEAVIAFLGILKARGTYVPVDTSYPPARIAAILSAAKPGLVLTRSASVSQVRAFLEADRAAIDVLLIDELQQQRSVRMRQTVQPQDAAYTFFTSGSTGQPKGVIVEHRALANYVRAASSAYDVRAGDRVLQAASLGFDLSLEEIVISLTVGATLVIRSAGAIESVQAFFEECIARRLTVLSITSALWHELTMRLADGTVDLPPLIRLVILGADAARPDALTAWQRATGGKVRLINSYGLTETTIVATVWEAGKEELSGDWRALPIGRPLRNVSAYVLDAKNGLVPVGVAGEICIGGLAVARGYLADDELTRARFVPDPHVHGGWMYRTGDRGILRSSGELEFLGRVDYRIKVRGVRIELGEIETRLREFPGVVEAVAVDRTNHSGETELNAYVMLTAPEVTSAQLRAHLHSSLPPAAVPARVHIVDRLPLTPAGKLDRRSLRATAPETERAEFVAPQTPLEKALVATTAEVLGVDQVGMQDGFLALGGTSLLALRAASLLGSRIGRPLSAQIFLEVSTFADLCAEIEGCAADEPVKSVSPSRAILADTVLPADIASGGRALPRGAALSTVLLTGATGYFGTFVLAELLRETEAHVVCLVRASSPDSARARIQTSLSRRACTVDPAVLAARVSFVCGDVAQPQFDLEPKAFEDLCERVDAVFHIAARVSMLLPYEALKASNALALEWVLRMATRGKPKTIHHVSTVEVLADMDRNDPIALTHRATAASPALLGTGYGQSKWVAEKLVEQARENGIRAYIHRPGRLTGHSSSGAFNEDDLLVQLLDACGRLGAAPMLDVEVDFTPVDAASRALVQLAKTASAQETFHLVRPAPPTWTALLETAIAIGYPLRVVSYSIWHSMLQELAVKDDRATFLHYLASLSREEMESSLRGGYETAPTCTALGPAFEWPGFDARLIGTYLRAMSGAGRFALIPSARRLSASAMRAVAPATALEADR